LDLNGFNQTITSLTNNGTVAGTVGATNSSATAATLTINNSAPVTFDNAGAGGVSLAVISGAALNLTKTGAGVLTLGGAPTFAGTTLVSAGELVLSGNRTATSGAISPANPTGRPSSGPPSFWRT